MKNLKELKVGEFISNEELYRYKKDNLFYVGEGLYTVLSYSKLLDRDVPPRISSMLNAYCQKEDIKIVPARNYASNLIGVSSQVPNTLEFITTGKSKELIFLKSQKVKLINHSTLIKHKYRLSSIIISSLMFEIELGNLNNKTLMIIGSKLTDLDYQNLLNDVVNEDYKIIEAVHKIKNTKRCMYGE